MILDPFLKHWTALNKKQIGVQEREAPLRDELYARLLLFTIALLALQFGLLWWEGIRGWGHGPFGFAFLTAFPAGYLLAAFVARKHPFRFAALFTVIVLTVTLPIAPSSRETFQYPQFGGALILTILLSGLLVGKSYVRIWTLACVAIQFSDVTHSWRVNALWGVLHVTAGWLVSLYSWHVERLNLASRAAEEQQRNAIVAERTRFARDIHDTLAQGFTGIMMQLNAAEQRLPGDSTEARAHIEKARQLASESLEEARRSVSALRAGALSGGSLLDAMEQIGRKLTTDSGVQLDMKLEGQPYALPEQCEANLLRIAQEALTNAVRHSGTERIGVRLAYLTGSVVLEVGDSGRGMSGVEPSGFGVDGMRERARQIGGEIRILTDPGRGTRIIVTVPNA
ncbi:MAG TPA: sensor histidine kinase [Bryobacteraceae bacterium]|nr:sensor histidine kinase [Bryobacteraceae bacterium]